MLVEVVPVPKVNPVAADVVPLAPKEKPVRTMNNGYFHKTDLDYYNTYVL